MASIILKKRKLCEAIDQELQILPSSYEVKRRLDDCGEYIQLYESILPQLRNLFPDIEDEHLMRTLKDHNNDILSTIEHLKYKKFQSPNKGNSQQSQDFDSDVLKVLNELYKCQSKEEGYDILKNFKNDILQKKEKKELRVDAENVLLRKAFKIQKKILIEENLKRKNTEDVLTNLSRELESSKSTNAYLLMKLNQLQMSCSQSYFNNHIY